MTKKSPYNIAERFERLEELMIDFFDMITNLTRPEVSYVEAWSAEEEWMRLNKKIKEIRKEIHKSTQNQQTTAPKEG